MAATLPTVRRGDRLVVLRIRRLGWSTRVHGRAVVVTSVIAALTVAVFVWSLAVGDFPLPVSDVLRSLIGDGSSKTDLVVHTLRLPRAAAAVVVGIAFGLSGAIFQRLARNPLTSPDIIGVNTGAAVAAVFVIVILQGSSAAVTAAALAGAALTAIAVYLLAHKRGVSSYRLVLIGIGIAAILSSVTAYLLTRAAIMDARRATVWLTGSLNGRGWDELRPLAIGLVLLLPLALGLAGHLRLLEMGDDAAKGLGAPVERSRALLLLTATSMAALAVAVAGPITFVALVAPQIARRLVGGRSLALLPSAACGALLLVASDLIARQVSSPAQLPVGIVTAVLGAPFLLFLLARANRIGAGG